MRRPEMESVTGGACLDNRADLHRLNRTNHQHPPAAMQSSGTTVAACAVWRPIACSGIFLAPGADGAAVRLAVRLANLQQLCSG
jgi:hypothetical protein